jgi:hypothetical protein
MLKRSLTARASTARPTTLSSGRWRCPPSPSHNSVHPSIRPSIQPSFLPSLPPSLPHSTALADLPSHIYPLSPIHSHIHAHPHSTTPPSSCSPCKSSPLSFQRDTHTQGFDDDQNTWEPIKNLSKVTSLVEAFDRDANAEEAKPSRVIIPTRSPTLHSLPVLSLSLSLSPSLPFPSILYIHLHIFLAFSLTFLHVVLSPSLLLSFSPCSYLHQMELFCRGTWDLGQQGCGVEMRCEVGDTATDQCGKYCKGRLTSG